MFRLPIWSIYILIVTTVILSLVILAKIWFPDWIDRDMFWKIFWTYIVLICSSAVIAKMTDYISSMQDKSPESLPQKSKSEKTIEDA